MSTCACRCNCKPFDLGVFSCAECIELPFIAEQSGIFKLITEWRDKHWIIKASIAETEYLKFQNILNEDSSITFQIMQPDGTYFEHLVYDGETLTATYCQFTLTVKEIREYTETVTAQEICGSEFDEEGNKIVICKTF